MGILRRCAALMGVLAGCYSPIAREGAPCESSDQCPSAQYCVLGSCSTRNAPMVDASPPEIDMAVDGPPIDAIVRLPCNTTGLNCRGGTATTFQCGGNCWVRCTAPVPRGTAKTACTGWMGALGEIDDATEDGCVQMK